jgi:hypothetical protein
MEDVAQIDPMNAVYPSMGGSSPIDNVNTGYPTMEDMAQIDPMNAVYPSMGGASQIDNANVQYPIIGEMPQMEPGTGLLQQDREQSFNVDCARVPLIYT